MVKLYAPPGIKVVYDADGDEYFVDAESMVDVPANEINGLLAKGFVVGGEAHAAAHAAMGFGFGAYLPISFGFIGDSLTAHCAPAISMTGLTPTTGFAAAYAENTVFSLRAWCVHGSMRSNGAWFPFEFVCGQGGSTSAQILANCVPAMLGYPHGQPNGFVVLAGTNDYAAGLTVAQSVAGVAAIWSALLAQGKPVVAATIPPATSLADGLSAPNRLLKARWHRQHAAALQRTARTLKISVVDFYSVLVGADGNWFDDAYHASGDYTHLSPLGATIMGKALNATIMAALEFNGLAKLPASFDDSADATQTRNPLFANITGTINTASSYPQNWNAPSPATISQVINSAGAEAGTGKTARPIGAGNTIGNVWELTGDGANSYSNYGTAVTCSVGDKIAIAFRIKLRPVSGLTGNSCLSPFVGALDNSSGHKIAGLTRQADFGGPAATCYIGNEADYPCGVFYFETTLKGDDFHPAQRIQFSTYNDAAPVAGDTLDVADFQIINLTARGIV